jgi:hypothetical protein
MARIAIYGKRVPDEAQPFVERTLASLREEGCEVTMYRGFQNRLNESWNLGLDLPEYTSAEALQALRQRQVDALPPQVRTRQEPVTTRNAEGTGIRCPLSFPGDALRQPCRLTADHGASVWSCRR